MGENTKIQWADDSFNPWIGCQKVSPGCTNCYAAENRFVTIQRGQGRELWGNEKRSERHVTSDANWRKPLTWNRKAEAEGVRRRVFPSLCDPFEDRPDLVEPRARLFELTQRTPWIDWMLLTKRIENAARMCPWSHYPRNVWIGYSAEDQARWDERTRHAIRVPAYLIFASCEPLIGPIDCGERLEGVDLLIAGGESGPDARPCNVDWIRSLVRQCRDVGTAPFVKQLGAKPYLCVGAHDCPPACNCGQVHDCRGRSGYCDIDGVRDPKGGDPSEWPADLRIREMPESPAVMRPAGLGGQLTMLEGS